MYRLRQVRPRLSGGLHLHRKDQEPRGERLPGQRFQDRLHEVHVLRSVRDPCPVDCIFMGSTYDQSCFSRDGCVVDFAKLPVETAWGQASLNPTAVAASKLTVEPVWTKPPDPPPPPKPAPAAAKT